MEALTSYYLIINWYLIQYFVPICVQVLGTVTQLTLSWYNRAASEQRSYCSIINNNILFEVNKTSSKAWVWKLVFSSLMMAIQWSSHFLLMRRSWSEKLLHWTAIVLDWLLGVSLGWPGLLSDWLPASTPWLLPSSLLQTCNNKEWYFKLLDPQSTCLKCIRSCLFKMNKNNDYIKIHFDLCWHAIQVC